MCCDGVLFHSVELQRGDSARQLSALGLKMRRKKGVEFFLQPCSAHREDDGACSCRIYDHRPSRCRLFNCRQLLGVTSGSISEETAFARIHEARSLVSRVNGLIARLGTSNSGRSLAHRVANALTLSSENERTPLHQELETAMGELEILLEREFRIAR
jgi:Fe-S-cluster containining protein